MDSFLLSVLSFQNAGHDDVPVLPRNARWGYLIVILISIPQMLIICCRPEDITADFRCAPCMIDEQSTQQFRRELLYVIFLYICIL